MSTTGNNVLVWDFLGLILAFISLILILRIIWRVEKGLDKFFKILSIISFLLILRQILQILTHINVIVTPSYFSFLDALSILILVIALGVMNSVIKKIDGEG